MYIVYSSFQRITHLKTYLFCMGVKRCVEAGKFIPVLYDIVGYKISFGITEFN